MNAIDLLFASLLAASVPVVVGYYLKRPGFSTEFRSKVILGGVLWVLYCLVSDQLLYLIFCTRADAGCHEYVAMSMAETMRAGDWDKIREYLRPGNQIYHAYVALVFYLTGATVLTINIINGYLAFLGGLVLARHFRGCWMDFWGGKLPGGRLSGLFNIRKNAWLFLLIIFFPSVIFWTSANLKEGMMYWAICTVFSRIRPAMGGVWGFFSPSAVIAVTLGGLLRPHVMVAWAVAVASVGLFQRGSRSYALLILISLPLLASSFRVQTDVDLMAGQGLSYAYGHLATLAQYKAGSDVEFEGGKPIFFLSGVVATFFRPFPWNVHSFRMAFSSVETWLTTLFMISIWIRMKGFERLSMLKMPEIRVALVACVLFCIFLSFLPNDGLMVRQRVQVVPALLALLVLPYLKRYVGRQRVRIEKLLEWLPYLPRNGKARSAV